MTEQELILASLARGMANKPADVQAVFKGAFDGEKSGGWSALRAANAALHKEFRFDGKGWGKRTEAEPAEAGYRTVECPQCAAVQPDATCTSCGSTQPPKYCGNCGNSVRSTCKSCGMYGADRAMVADPVADTRCQAATLQGIRTDAAGLVTTSRWVNSNQGDSYRTLIEPDD